MPSLSFIKPKTTKWKSIVHNRTPFSSSRSDNRNINFPHPYASPDILDINDDPSSSRSTPEPPPKSPTPRHLTPPLPPPPPAAPSTSLAPPTPPIQIDIDLSSEPFNSDWFQTRFTASPSPTRPIDKGIVSNRITVGRNSTVEVAEASHEARTVVDEDDDIDVSSSGDDVLDDLKAMDASTILGISRPSNKMVQPPSSSSMKRTTPAPIKIPNFHMHGPQVQLIRSGEAKSRPLSEVSSIESSAVSGQTLARALLGNSFILSGDTRSSRYRSGFGGLVRSDSATLPRGDHPLMNSPYGKDRSSSGLGDTFAIGCDAPPIPANADKVYVPPRAPRTSSLELKKHNVRRTSSTSSLAALKDESGDSKSRPSSFSDFSHEVERMDIQALRRISRISEAPSTPSTGVLNPESTPAIRSSEELPVEPSAPQGETSAPLPSESSTHSPSASWNHKPPDVSITSSNEPKDLDVVEYYASEMQKTFAPVFSPITEETSSQLSTPGSRRLSQRGIPRAISPLSGTLNGRMDLSSVRRPSDGAVINRNSSSHRRSIQASPELNAPLPSTNLDSNVNGSSSGRRVSQVPPVAGRVVGGRSRSGSAPGPIKITRDSRDYNTYKIVSPFPDNPSETPLTGDSGLEMQQIQQTFPETPNVFSPYWASGINSPGMVQGQPEGQQVPPLSQTPTASQISHSRGPHASDQQILTRAAAVVQASHSRQSSLVRRMLPQPQVPAVTSESNGGTTIDGGGIGGTTEEGPVQIVQAPPSRPTETSPATSPSQYSVSNEDSRPSFDEHNTGFAVIEAALASPWSRVESPTLGSTIWNGAPHSSPSAATFARSHSPLSNNGGPAQELSTPLNAQTNSPHPGQRTPVSSPHNRYVQASLPAVIIPPAGEPIPTASSPYLGRTLRRISEISHSFESPPPYDTIDHDRPPSITPTLSNSNDEQQSIGGSTQTSPPIALDSSNESPPLGRKASTNRDRRVRPRPGGPRRPLSNLLGPGRSRNASESSATGSAPNVATTSSQNPFGTPLLDPKSLPNDLLEPGPSWSGTMNGSDVIAPSLATPNFNIPPMPYRGLTMDQAKWTFTSSQLQSIVSRAIRQSAEASSIRLLRLDTIDNEIPQDLQRLETQKSEIKIRYQSLTRTSKLLFSKLNNQIASGSGHTQRTVDELKETVQQLNTLSEQLHVVDQQHAKIQKLVEVHSASALSMALRKLNASFLKQVAQTQELQRQVGDMEEEIWSLREWRTCKASPDNQPQVFPSLQSSSQQAGFRPHMIEFPTASSAESEKKRVTLSNVSRKSSLRYSKSNGLSGRLSHRSSLSSSGVRGSISGGTSGTKSGFRIPTAPPLPRRRPTDIFTEPPTRSTTMLSTDDGTSDAEVRAMIRAQEELYQSLGISLGGDVRLNRSHSIIGLPGSPELQPHPSASGANTISPSAPVTRLSRFERESSLSRHRASNRPLSYPASLLDAYNRLDADRHAMLATLEMMSRDDH